jgi:hypothetical protein
LPNIIPPRRIICASSSGFSRIIVGLLAHHRRVVGAADAPAGSAPLAKVKRALTARA